MSSSNSAFAMSSSSTSNHNKPDLQKLRVEEAARAMALRHEGERQNLFGTFNTIRKTNDKNRLLASSEVPPRGVSLGYPA